MQFLDALNPEQRRAAEADEGAVLIVAGPGTGKTKTLTARIAYLLSSGNVIAADIIALTFTNKAAAEMRERVTLLLGNDAVLPAITTFHAFGRQLLKQTDDSALVSDAERSEIIKKVSKPSALKGTSTRELSLLISSAKTTLSPLTDRSVAQLLEHYNQELAARHLIDFDDLLCKAYNLLRHGTIASPQYRHVLVDEFQDTSELQYELLRSLGTQGNVFAIGDPNQSIYSFRGAGAEMFDRFVIDFPVAQHIALTINYRSSPEVVHLGNAVFPMAPALIPHHTATGVVHAIQTLNEYSEAAYILREIEQGIGGSDMLKASGDSTVHQLRDYAVLYRTHRAAQAVRKQFAESGIPYQVAGDDSPYAKSPLQALIALMRYIQSADPADKQALLRLPTTHLSSTQCDALLARLPSLNTLSVVTLAQWLAKHFNIWPEDAQQDLHQFCSTLVQFGSGESGLVATLAHIDAICDQAFYDPTVNAVTLLTIHAAKGLEFEHVFLCAAEEGVLPKIRKTSEPNIAEERRLFYVAATRARRQLDVLHAKYRGGTEATPSRFIAEVPVDILPRITDPAMETLQKRAEKRRHKRAQTSLF
jgi:superfamily I DNA/RNA helicase